MIRGALNGSLPSGTAQRPAGHLQLQVGSHGQLNTTAKFEPTLTVQTDDSAQPNGFSFQLAPVSTDVSMAQTPITQVRACSHASHCS